MAVPTSPASIRRASSGTKTSRTGLPACPLPQSALHWWGMLQLAIRARLGRTGLPLSPIAYFDVYVSDNGAPFTVWQTHTLQTGALFNGVLGHSYAFYSVATDSAGNVQAPPAIPDALTVAD